MPEGRRPTMWTSVLGRAWRRLRRAPAPRPHPPYPPPPPPPPPHRGRAPQPRPLPPARPPRPAGLYPLRRPLPLPYGVGAAELRRFLLTVRPDGAPADEMARYCAEDFERFVLTWDLARGLTGDCLELGANPYFTTMLL